jgi:hypothetical protein
VVFGRDTIASFLRDTNEVTVLLSQGNVSMLHPNGGTPVRVKAGQISITPAAAFKTLGEVAMLNGSVVVTAKEGGKRSVWAVWTGLILRGILPSGHPGCVHLEGRWTLVIPQ